MSVLKYCRRGLERTVLGDTQMERGGNLSLEILDGSSPGAACLELAQLGTDCFMKLHHPHCSGEKVLPGVGACISGFRLK